MKGRIVTDDALVSFLKDLFGKNDDKEEEKNSNKNEASDSETDYEILKAANKQSTLAKPEIPQSAYESVMSYLGLSDKDKEKESEAKAEVRTPYIDKKIHTRQKKKSSTAKGTWSLVEIKMVKWKLG